MKVLFMGRKAVAEAALRLVYATPGVEVVGVLTDSHLQGSPTACAARELGLSLYTYDEATAEIDQGSLAFELGLSVLYWRRIRPPLLDHPPLGIVNFHPAPLPEFKGVGGYNLAILEALDRWAASAHYVDATIDTGDIIDTQEVEIDLAHDTVVSLEKKTNAALLELFRRVWAALASSADSRLPTRPNIGGRHLSRAGLETMKRIDLESDDLERKVRAFWFPPYDGAYIEVGSEKYTLVSRAILETLGDSRAVSLFSKPVEDD